jgi:hypothetical protein
MIRTAALVAALLSSVPAVAQDVNHVPAMGSSPDEGRALLEPICNRFVLAEEQYLTCTWDTGEALTGSYTKSGRLYYVQWLFPPGERPNLEPIVGGLGFPLTRVPSRLPARPTSTRCIFGTARSKPTRVPTKPQ